MAIIFCGKNEDKEFLLKDADIKVYSLQELAYFIFNYSILISHSFVTKNLIYHIDKAFDNYELSNKLNIMYNQKEDVTLMVYTILRYSNFYNADELKEYDKKVEYLRNLDTKTYITLAGDYLYKLKKYEKAITKYEKNIDNDTYSLKMVGYCYAKLQVYDKAIEYLSELFNKTFDESILKDLFTCYKLSENINEFDEKYSHFVDANVVTEWEVEIVKKLLEARSSERVKEIEEIFLMGENYIKPNMTALINTWKEQYRYIG